MTAEKKEFKAGIMKMRMKPDEENFEEAVAQAYRAWTETKVRLHTCAPSSTYLTVTSLTTLSR